ncbi:STAS domain-containing protein [Lentzea sp. NBRC 102530]|uniref:STAS domain-containing protein n=1 Tax=Lentzea sp. NBRC 102530 TaxID=3032201 RepID=UPI0024A16ED3|nr:STAS domain-containing protein [Lentzea sp. NBRC 102530]GLY47797.1 anti-sigma factor antagonist [Lentzea sp. NBRC 102530]
MNEQPSGTTAVLTARTEHQDGVAVLVVTGEIDRMTDESPLREALDAVRRGPAALVIDLDAVSFFGSTGINLLITVEHQARAMDVPFAVVAGARRVLKPLAITGVDALLPLYPNRVEAFLALRSVPRPRRG